MKDFELTIAFRLVFSLPLFEIMKLNKAAYFSIFFLVCFVSAFSFNNYYKLHNSETSSSFKKSQSISYSQKENNSSNQNDFLFEENENQKEKSFELQAHILPFIISFAKHCIVQQQFFSVNPLTEKTSNPIYISVCNFRI